MESEQRDIGLAKASVQDHRILLRNILIVVGRDWLLKAHLVQVTNDSLREEEVPLPTPADLRKCVMLPTTPVVMKERKAPQWTFAERKYLADCSP